MVTFSQDRGFGLVSATVITEHTPTLTEFRFITNASSTYMPEFEDLEAARLDPVSQHAATSYAPLLWNQATYVESGQGDLWERQAPFGYKSGLVFAYHFPRGRHFLFGPDCDRPICMQKSQSKQLIEDFYIFASHAQAAAFELCLDYDPPAHEIPDPTSSELEALRWAMDGMTNWEIGRKLDLSERDVALRLGRVMNKLGCRTKYEAALKAIRLRLLDCN